MLQATYVWDETSTEPDVLIVTVRNMTSHDQQDYCYPAPDGLTADDPDAVRRFERESGLQALARYAEEVSR